MHSKTDSEDTTIEPSSPPRSPRRQIYYVQSPSRDSHDGEKTINASFHSSPSGSPPHSQSSLGRHSRESSASRFSGSLKPGAGSRKVNPNDATSKSKKRLNKEVDVIEEEGLLEDNDSHERLSRRCYFLAFVVGFLVLFSLFSLILWGASRSQRPRISVLSIRFEQFKIQAGTDRSGVTTDMISVNSTVKMVYRNTGTFFGVHVSSSPVDLSYSQQITVASGSIKKFYQSRNGRRIVEIMVAGNMIPLYGNIGELSSASATEVQLDLDFMVRSRAYVLGKLVNPKFLNFVSCYITYDTAKPNATIPLKKSCTYH